jgi:protein SCO1/2
MNALVLLTLALAGGPVGEPGSAPPSSSQPPDVANLSFDQRLNAQVPLDATFRDERGQDVQLAELVRGRPVILVLAYYRCPQLCNLVLNGLVDGLRGVTYRPGEEYEIVTVSFDDRESPEIAAAKKASYVDSYGRPGAADHWHFLTGHKDQIDRVAEAVGFHYDYDSKHDRFNHPSGVVVLTPEGNVSRYLFGINYPPRDLKLGLMEASQGQVGSLVDQFLLYCFHYDQATGKYAFAVMNAIRAGGALTVLVLGALLLRLWRREKHRLPQPEATV